MNVLVIAPHNDDEVLGVGGTIARHRAEGDQVYVLVATTGLDEKRRAKIRAEATRADGILGITKRFFLDIPVVEMDITSKKLINKRFVDVINQIQPKIVYLPHAGDIHEDHKETAKAAMVALRPYEAPFVARILAYETLSESEWENPTLNTPFIPNIWNDISDFISKKIEAMNCYSSQIREYPHPRSLDAIKSLAKYRGSTVGMQYAEAFMLIAERNRLSY